VQPLAAEHWGSLREWLLPERACSLIGWHTLATGVGKWWVDRWPRPACGIAFAGGNLTFAGDPERLGTHALPGLIAELRDDWDHVFMEVPEPFRPAVLEALDAPSRWPRVIYTTNSSLQTGIEAPPRAVRRLGAGDAPAVAELGEDLDWISDTLGGPEALAGGQSAFGAFVEGRLVSVAVPFYIGEGFEELGVVTDAAHRGAGWSTACAKAVVADMQARDRLPCWATTPDNAASRRVAEKLGLSLSREEMHYMEGDPITGALPAE
jgi:RimJ/RimL family protein N-acetyltransferase